MLEKLLEKLNNFSKILVNEGVWYIMRENNRIDCEIEFSYLDLELSRLYIDLYVLHSIKDENEKSIFCLRSIKKSKILLGTDLYYSEYIDYKIDEEQFSSTIISSRINNLFLEILDKKHRKDIISKKLEIK